MALATEVRGTPVVLTHHRVEHGVDQRAGEYAVLKVRRWIDQDGEVTIVHREIVSWWPDMSTARSERDRLNGAP